MKNKCTIKIELYTSCTRECTLCGKTFSGEESVVWWKSLMHVMLHHPIKFAECMWCGVKEKFSRKDNYKKGEKIEK